MHEQQSKVATAIAFLWRPPKDAANDGRNYLRQYPKLNSADYCYNAFGGMAVELEEKLKNRS